MAILPCSLVLFFNMLSFFIPMAAATATTDIITQSQPLVDDGKSTLVSKDGRFELGFFSLGTSTNRYVGLWFRKVPVRYILWVANGEKPLKDKLGMIAINKEGHLTILSQNQTLIWIANTTTTKALVMNPIAQLLDSGNLVLRDEKDQDPQNCLWQSFDYYSNVFLPGMKLGWDSMTGLNRRLVAWKNWDDPSPSDFTCELMRDHSFPEIYVRQGGTISYRSGPWNGDHFVDTPSSMKSLLYNATLVHNKDELYYVYAPLNESMISIRVLNLTRNSLQNLMWIEEDQTWKSFGDVPRDNCGRYNLCGAFGICSIVDSTLCQCLRGFEPKSPKNWDIYDWKAGCVRSEPWSCKVKDKDNFVKFSNLKLPDTTHTWVNASMTLEECKAKCWENCSCTAYANSDIMRGGSGCVMWFGDLLDLNQMSSDAGQDLYIRLASTDMMAKHEGVNPYKIKITTITTSVLALGMLLTFLYILRSRRKSKENTGEVREGDMELPFYDFTIIASATQNFSDDNKLGQGGFGSVYKGTLAGGQEIAVKRLSQHSQQGVKEFKNEVMLCAKLQHRNLVKVLGCCIQGEEKMLIYEYMSNKSLDSFIFGSPTQRKLLCWFKRFHIICGIARGLMYLHQDLRMRIIHRDLKASNILLDNELNPKISDFGLAKIFGKDENEENTRRIIGTYGYMAPEYAIYGLFSMKSDVFSFGILLLETVSGMKNGALSLTSHSVNLIGHAWRLWKEGIPLELIDANLGESYDESEVLRCIHIGLLCVQHHPDDRPNMTSVVVMLSSESDLPQPKEPGFLLESIPISKLGNYTGASINEISITQLEPR